jgi:sporulation protein YlmC with PRC-barrel domain
MWSRGPRIARFRWSRLRGTPIVDTESARQAGLLSDVYVSLAGQLEAIEVLHGDGLLRRLVAAPYVERLNPNAVLIDGWSRVEFAPAFVPGPDSLSLEGLLGARVQGVGGERVGRIADVDLDATHMLVERYHVATPIWTFWRGSARLRPADVLSGDDERVYVSDDLAEALNSRRPRLPLAQRQAT